VGDRGKIAGAARAERDCAGEHNYLLNPTHPKFGRNKIGEPERFELDLRLIR